MSIPGLEPVSAEEESFEFTGEEGDGSSRPSKYVFDEGQYLAKCVSLVKGVSGAGNPQYVASFIGLEGPASGLEFREYLPLSGKAVWKTENTVKALGVQKGPNNKYAFKPSDVVGKSALLDLVKDTYDGKTRMKIKAVLTPNVAKNAPASDGIPF